MDTTQPKIDTRTSGQASGNLQLVEISHMKAGKKPVKRLKARHLSALTQATIVRLFSVHQSFEDVADEMDLKGLTGRTVSEVLHIHQMRKGPHVEHGSLFSVRDARRTA